MIVLYSLCGVALYVFFAWFKWSNQVDRGEADPSLNAWLYSERQEFAAVLVGAILFMIGGEGLIDALCSVVGHVWSDSSHDLCTSIQVDLEELIYVIGGGSFSSVLFFLIKLSKRKAKKKLDEI